MKIIGVLLILGALIGGGIILSDTIPGYFRNKTEQRQRLAEAAKIQDKLAALGPNASEAEILHATRDAEQMSQQLRFDQESVERRRNETLEFGGGALVVLIAGVVLFMRGRRKSKSAGTGAVATHSV